MSPKKRRNSGKRRRARIPRSGLVGIVLFVAACCSVARHAIKEDDPVTRAERDRRQIEVEESGPVPVPLPDESLEPVKEAGQLLLSPFCLGACPEHVEETDNTILGREGWLLSNNPQTKFADWAAYRITPSTIGKSKRGDWEADPSLPEDETLEPEDFKGAHAALGTDRGHQVPLASFSGTKSPRFLNFLSNLTPQKSELNQRLWNHLEQAERALVFKKDVDALFVVTGPLYEKEMPELPGADEPHQLPSGYFKVIALDGDEGIRTAAIIVSQETPCTDSHCDHRVTIDEVEKRAGLDLFPALSPEEQAALESVPGDLFKRLGCR